MTGFLNDGVNPLSRVTIARFEDMGYEVDYGAADPYTLPSQLELAMLGAGTELGDHGGRGVMLLAAEARPAGERAGLRAAVADEASNALSPRRCDRRRMQPGVLALIASCRRVVRWPRSA